MYPSRALLVLSVMTILLSCCISVSSAFHPLHSSTKIYCSRGCPAHTRTIRVEHHRQRDLPAYPLNRATGVCSDIHLLAAHRQAVGALYAVSKRQVAVLDGAALYSVESFLAAEDGPTAEKPIRSGLDRLGFLTVLAGTVEGDGVHAGKRVVGVEMAEKNNSDAESSTSLGDGAILYSDSVATIPTGISDADAVATMMASLSAVHCALPISENVGGSTDVTVSGRAVVVGGGEYATFAADALATLGAEVYQISTGKPKPSNANGELD